MAEAERAASARQPGAAEVASDAEEAQPPEAALDAVAEPQQAVAAAEPDAAAAQLPGVAAEELPDEQVQQPEAGHPSAGLLLGAGGAAIFLGLRHDERRGLRMRCRGRELSRRQGGRGEQQDAKVCHDILGPRNRPDSNEWPSLACQLVD